MEEKSIKGRIHSLQSMGTVDGPGVRFVVFMQGCHLRCGCCHNPDTWSMTEGSEYTPSEILKRVLRCREYFGSEGGITVSGGEPLLQPRFCRELFELCHKEGINTCLDTSGSILGKEVEILLDCTDRVLLDIKYADDRLYRKYVGCSIEPVLEFLGVLQEKQIATTVRNVVIPTLNNDKQSIDRLYAIANSYSCVDKVELLPFKKICQVKYDQMGIEFPFAHIPTE